MVPGLSDIPDGIGGVCHQTFTIDCDARLNGVYDDGSTQVVHFSVTVSAPYVDGRLGIVAGGSQKWLIALAGDGNTLASTAVQFTGDPQPVIMPAFTRIP